MKVFVQFVLIALGLNAMLFIFGCNEKPQKQMNVTEVTQVIYGEDNRKDYADVSDANLKEMARSTVALISKDLMTLDTVFNVYRFEKPASALPLCSSEKFHEQSTWAHCSGSLIASDLILTAGHCVTNVKDCKSAYYVFDYELQGNEKIFSQVSADSVYSCSEILYTTVKKGAADFAIIRLDRKVENRLPFEFSEKEVTYQDQLMMIGHPEGYPTKFTFDGKVRSLMDSQHLTIAIDAYTGNSGSPVFDQATHKIVGVLSRGEIDYVRKNSCLVSNVCEEKSGCRGEDVTRIDEVKKFLPKELKPDPAPVTEPVPTSVGI